MNRRILQSNAFLRDAKRYLKRHPECREPLQSTLRDLETDAFQPRLRTHKLKGELAQRWSCSAGYDLRVVFRFVEYDGQQAILLLTIGSHDDVH